MDLRTSIDLVGTLPVLTLSGTVDVATVPQLHDGLHRLTTDHPGERVAVDLEGVDGLDDTGLGVLLGAAGRARQFGGDLIVVCAGERMRRRFAVTGLDRAVSVVDALAELLST